MADPRVQPGKLLIGEQPASFEDMIGGQVCVLSRMWFPASMIVETPLGPVGAPYAGDWPEDLDA